MDEIKLNNADWLARFLEKTRLSPFSLAAILLLINFVVDFLLASIFGGVFKNARTHGLINEPIAFTSDLLVPSVLIGYYCWIQTSLPQIIQSLVQENVISLDEAARKLIERASNYAHSKLLSGLILMISIAASFSFALSVPISNPNYVGWVVINPIIPWIRSVFNVLSIYTGFMLILDLLILAFLLTQIFNNQTIKVKPSHPDKSGGLGTIGRFAANLAYLFAVFGILVSVSLLSNTLTQGIASNQLYYLTKVGGLIVYIIAAPLLFFVPLISSHLAMLAFRDSFLFDLGKEIDDEYAKIQMMRSKLNAGELDEITKRINYFRELYSQAKEFPVWPFNAQNIGKFFGFVSGAVLPGIVSVVSKFFGF